MKLTDLYVRCIYNHIIGVMKFCCQYFPFPTFIQIEILIGVIKVATATNQSKPSTNKMNRILLLSTGVVYFIYCVGKLWSGMLHIT